VGKRKVLQQHESKNEEYFVSFWVRRVGFLSHSAIAGRSASSPEAAAENQMN
jgi:hypothetical protein